MSLPLALLLILAAAVAAAVLWPGKDDVNVNTERIFDPWRDEEKP